MFRDGLVDEVYDDLDGEFTKTSLERILNSVISMTKKNLRDGEPIVLTNFGTFNLTTRKAKPGRNPKTGASVKVPDRKVITFKAAKSFAAEIKKLELD